MSNVIDVTAYGAVGDGTTDDTSAIASAVAACPSSDFGLYFPPGTYLCNPSSASLLSWSSKNNFSIYGNGLTASTIKAKTGSKVLQFATSCSQVTIKDIGLDGGCTSRLMGMQALFADCSSTHLRNLRIINSGEYAIYFGSGSTLVEDITIEGCVIQDCYADGIHIGYCKNVLISGNLLDGCDDDCIAIDHASGGAANNVLVCNNICRSRTDTGQSWGRGIAVIRASNVQVIGNLIENIKQDGLLVYTDDNDIRPSNILIFGNTIRNVAQYAGSNAMGLYFISNGNVAFNKIYNPANGNGIELGDWQNLTVSNNEITSDLDQYFRAIHATESSSAFGVSFSSPFNILKLVNNTVSLLSNGSSALYNECIRLNAGGSYWTQDFTIISGNTCYQANGTSSSAYIDFDYGGSSGVAKIINNTCAQARTIGTGSHNLITPFTANNN